MIELRPLLVQSEAPLLLAAHPGRMLGASPRPLIRGVILAAILSAVLGLPVLRTWADGQRPAFRGPAEQGVDLNAPRLGATRVARAALR